MGHAGDREHEARGRARKLGLYLVLFVFAVMAALFAWKIWLGTGAS